LTALLNALSGGGGAAPKINGTTTTVAPQAQPEAVIELIDLRSAENIL
jgi:hypothetical protein